MSDEVIITVVEEGVKEVEVTDGSRWGSIGGDIDDQTDLQSLLNTKVDAEDLGEMSFADDAPSDHNEYVRKDGDWHIASGSGTLAWGDISGTLSDQTDLQSALNAKANAADLGSMAEEDDAPSDSKEYVRKNGAWSEASGGGGAWGEITGTLSDQTDLQNALNGKSNTGHDHDDRYYTESEVNTRLAGKLFIYSSDTLSYWDDTPTADSTKPVTSRGIKTALDGKSNTGHTHDDRYYTETEVDTALSAKANNSILGDAFSTSVAYAIGDYCIYQGALYRFTSAHSAGAWSASDVTQVVAMNELAALSAQVASRMDFKITGTVSASNYTLTDSRINDNHWEVLSIYFETPGNVTTQIHWTTDITNHTVSLSATYAGSTNVVVKMHWVQ